MTKKQETKKQNQATKSSNAEGNTKPFEKEMKSLNSFFEKLKEEVLNTANELGLRLEKPQDYYVVFSHIVDGELRIDSASICTNLNIFASKGMGFKYLKMDLEVKEHFKDVTIINVIKCGE